MVPTDVEFSHAGRCSESPGTLMGDSRFLPPEGQGVNLVSRQYKKEGQSGNRDRDSGSGT